MGGAKPIWFRMTNPSPNGTKIEIAKSIAVVRRSPLQRNGRTTRPEKMSRMPLIHIKGKAAGSLDWDAVASRGPNRVEYEVDADYDDSHRYHESEPEKRRVPSQNRII